ncbi:hypothetical protein ACT18_22375 [Mycolicibacter kumamotonensis]|uniref:Mammalian cell entry related domain protein n=1 Tax=Mycolicibacter kumamotonensis TaxID=354243 RepID=A0A1B8S9Z4_9MYCO|nr:hypothetical protein ACT18_22375 [Mycolicibacter kumamotonensis]
MTQAEQRKANTVGLALLAVVSVILTLTLAIERPRRTAENVISVAIDASYVGQGVAEGTHVVMHGAQVGEIRDVSRLAGGQVRMNVELRAPAVAGLTDAVRVDFRPTNYFGVTGVNLLPTTGGEVLRDGMTITTTPKGNFTIEALLSRLGEVSNGVLTQQLVEVIDRATRYTDALNPLIETALIVASSVSSVQTVSTRRLLANATGISVAFPAAADSLVTTGWNWINNDVNLYKRAMADYTNDEWQNRWVAGLEEVSVGVFGRIGKLEASDAFDLLPLVDALQSVFAVVPPVIRPEGFAEMLKELRQRFEKMYQGTPDQRAMRIQVVLDQLPGVVASN